MAAVQRSLVQDQIADVTECSICTEIFTNPKILPCVHTFCLHCLETYGKDKKPGDQMVCPICRKEFIIPYGGFSQLANNFFIGKMVEIGKLASTPTRKSLCALCPEDDEVLAELFCVDCEQNLCSRCSNGHKKSKCSQNHQVVELGSQPKAHQLNLRNSYCDHHPGETIKMFCYEDNVAICLICCVESHQSHRCVNVNKAAEEFTEQLKTSMKKVADRLPECDEVAQKLDKFKNEFAEDVLETEKFIHDATTQLKKLIDQQTEILMQNLTSLKGKNLKAIEITKQDVDRFKVMIDSFSRYCKELLARGSPVDVCGAANHLLTRANELLILPANCSGGFFRCDSVSFRSSNIVGFLGKYGKNIAVGELTVTQPSHRLLTFLKETSVSVPFCSVGVGCGFLPMNLGEVEVITMYMKDKLDKINAELKQSFGSMDTDKDEPGFIIRGNETGIAKAGKDLQKLTDGIFVYDHDIDRPAIPAYFRSRSGNEVLRGIQIRNKVSIQLGNTPFRRRGQAGATQRTRTVAGPRVQSEAQHEERHPKDLNRIILSIYALSKKAIDDVLTDIEEVIKEYIIDKVLDSEKDQENIAKLNEAQVKRIKGMTNMFPVQIEVETGRLKRIRIRGPPMEVTSVMDHVHVIFQEAQEKEIKNNEGHWEYEDGNDFEKYPDEINAIIERAYRGKKPHAELELHDAKYRLTFQKMVVEFLPKSGTPPVKVRRVANDMEIPSHWESMKNDEDLKRISLSARDQEYKDVEKAVRATAQTTVNQIVKIERIQNKLLYKQYVVRKAAMDAANPGVQNEMTLWHGTAADTLESINRTGFNRSYCGKNAFVYGRGVYFVKNFSYSAQNTYSPPDANGDKHIYQCKVLTGEFALGNQTMIVPPSYAWSTTKKYNSTVDNIAAPTIFVIFYYTQAFPEYLVYFK